MQVSHGGAREDRINLLIFSLCSLSHSKSVSVIASFLHVLLPSSSICNRFVPQQVQRCQIIYMYGCVCFMHVLVFLYARYMLKKPCGVSEQSLLQTTISTAQLAASRLIVRSKWAWGITTGSAAAQSLKSRPPCQCAEHVQDHPRHMVRGNKMKQSQSVSQNLIWTLHPVVITARRSQKQTKEFSGMNKPYDVFYDHM